MSVFAKVTAPPKIHGDYTKQLSLVYAALLVVMIAAQLFTFEDFPSIIASFQLPVGNSVLAALPAVIVACELLALPFLLRAYLSPAFRYVSMGAGWVSALLWLSVSLWVVLTHRAPETMGFLGSVVTLIPGAWVIFFSLCMVILSLWASWGMWPGRPSIKPHSKKVA